MAFPKLEEAIAFALDAHAKHYRRGEDALPFFVHPMDVLYKVWHLGGVRDEDVLCAAALHDVVEDTGIGTERLEVQFGPRVASLVRQLTRAEPTEEEVAASEVSERELSFDMLLRQIGQMESGAQTVKLADRLSNLWDSSRTMEAESTRAYAREAQLMLETIPREQAPELWDELDLLTKSIVSP